MKWLKDKSEEKMMKMKRMKKWTNQRTLMSEALIGLHGQEACDANGIGLVGCYWLEMEVEEQEQVVGLK